ncbi:MAG: hypothetical protein AB7V62_06280 [Thermoleophilia bacterium]
MPRLPRRSMSVPAAVGLAVGALVVGIAGTGAAQALINGNLIQDRSIPAGKLKQGAVGTAELRNSAVQARDIQNGAVTVSKLKRAAVTGPKIAPGAVGTANIANGAVTRTQLAANARLPELVINRSVVVGVNPGTIGQAAVECGAGQVLVAGGGGPVATAVGVNLEASRPEAGPDGVTPARWQIIVENESPTTPLQIQAYAICATSS